MASFFTASVLGATGIVQFMTDTHKLSSDEKFLAYRRMLASPVDEDVHWWYFGTVIITIEGLPPLPAINAATLMIYRTETLAKNRFAIHWDEIGYFADYSSGNPVLSWLNPVTGKTIAASQNFAEGPARYDITKAPDGVSVTLTQPGATVNSIDIDWRCEGDRIWIVQRESKTRGFPEVDGRLPDPASASGFEAMTRLAFMDERRSSGSATQGLYEFALAGAPPWMGFDPALKARATVHGVILKASVGDAPRPESLIIMRNMFPAFFDRHRA